MKPSKRQLEADMVLEVAKLVRSICDLTTKEAEKFVRHSKPIMKGIRAKLKREGL